MIITYQISNNNELIVTPEYCCTAMKEAYSEELIEFGNPGRTGNRHVNLVYRVWECGGIYPSDTGGDYDYNVLPINWCPFCKAPIIIVETEYTEEDASRDANAELQHAQAGLKYNLTLVEKSKARIATAAKQCNDLLEKHEI